MNVLVAVDGSKHSAESLRVASHFAKASKAKITILTVIPPIADIDLELSPSERDKILESMKSRGEDLLARSREQMKTHGAAEVRTVLATAPSPAQEIVAFAEKEKTDLIVIGSKGRGAAARFLLGSIAANVVRHSHCCVYVVKEPCWI